VTEEQKSICNTSPSSQEDSDANKHLLTAEVSEVTSSDDDLPPLVKRPRKYKKKKFQRQRQSRRQQKQKAEAADVYISEFLSSNKKKSISVRNLLSGGDSGRNYVSNRKEKHEWFAFSVDNNPQKAPLSSSSAERTRKKQNDGATSSLDRRSEGKKKYDKFKAREKKHKLVMLEKDNLKGIVENHLVCGSCSVDDADEKVFTFADSLRTKLPEEYHELIDGVVTDYRKQKTKDGNKVVFSYSHVG